MGNLFCAREYSVHFFVQFFYTVKLRVCGALTRDSGNRPCWDLPIARGAACWVNIQRTEFRTAGA